MENNKNFSEFLIEFLKQIHIRLDRLDAKIDTKADKEDVRAVKEDISAVKEDVRAVKEDISAVKEDVNTLGKRLDRIEVGIATLRWIIGVEVAIIGVILAFLKAC